MSFLTDAEARKAIQEFQTPKAVFQIPEGTADWVIEDLKKTRNIKTVVKIAPKPAAVETTPAPTAITNGPLQGALRMAALGVPVAPVKAKEKFPPIKDFPNLATTDEAQILAWSQERVNCNWLVLAKPDGVCFIDEDQSNRLRALYEQKYNEPYPDTRSTESRSDHRQSCWKQTDRTRAFGNHVQADFVDGMMSFRASNEYCLCENSVHPSGSIYQGNDKPILEMPDKLMDLIESLLAGKAKKKEDDKRAGKSTPYVPLQSGEKVPMYHRNDSCHEYAFHRWTKDCVSVEQLIADVYAFNQEHCDPPLDESELDRTVIPSVQKFRQNGPVLVGGVPVGSAPAAQTAQPVVWGEPGVIENPLLPVLPFLPEFLPACVRPWAVDVAQRMSVPLDFTGICLLITLAGVVNRRAFVYPKKNDKEWKEALSISGAVVADSGKLKTPTWNVFTNVLVEIELNWKRTNKKLQDQYKADMKAWREGEKARKERVKKGATEEPLPEPVKPPPCRSLIENDMTPEVFHSSMSENPAGLFVFRDELAGWVAELDKEGREQEQEIFLGAMNGNDARKCKRIGRGEVFAIMSASLFGGFQPDLLRDFLNKAQKKHDGLIQRFGALVYPDPVLFHRMDRAADTKMKDAFVLLVRKLSWMDAEAISFHFDSTAQERFDKWYDAHDIKTARETNVLKQSHLAKYRGLLPKFAALLQLADVVTELPEHSTVIGPHYIDLEHLEQAIGLLTYLESHMHRIYGCVRNEAQVAEEVVAEHIKSGALRDGFTTRDIRRKCWKGLQNNDTIYGALEYLEEVSWVRRSSQQLGAGRKTDRWEINPAVTERRNEK